MSERYPRRELTQKVENVLMSLRDKGIINYYAYDHINDSLRLPYAIYRRTAIQNFAADGRPYYHRCEVTIEIYERNDRQMLDLMEQLESAMDEEDLYYDTVVDTEYVSDEQIYISVYQV